MKFLRVTALMGLLLLSVQIAFSQTPYTFDFGKSISLGSGYFQDSYVDTEGNYYLAGQYGAGNYFQTSGAVVSMPVFDVAEAFIAKYDPAGNLVWVNGFSGEGEAVARKIAVDNNGGVYVVGYYGAAGFTNASLTITPGVELSLNDGSNNGFIVKLDAAGTYQWHNEYATEGFDEVTGVTVHDDNVYILGALNSTVFFEKRDFENVPGYSKNLFTTDFQYGLDIYVNNFNELLITGYFSGTIGVNPENASETYASAGNIDGFLSMYNANDGTWRGVTRTFGGSDNDIPQATAERNGYLYITGTYYTDFSINGVQYLTSAGLGDTFIMKFVNGSGLDWVSSIGNANEDAAYDIDVNENGAVYLTGGYSGTVDFDPNGDVINLTSFSDYDAFILKLDEWGNYQFASSLGHSDPDFGYTLSLSNNYFMFSGGFSTITSVDFDPGAGVVNLGPGIFPFVKYQEVPVITDFSPKSGVPGDYVYVHGYNFSEYNYENIIYFGGVRGEVTYSRENYLEVRVPLGASNDPLSISVNGISSNSLDYFSPAFYATGSMSFGPRKDFPLGTAPKTVTAADFDRDGKIDFAVPNAAASPNNFISIVENNSTPGDVVLQTGVVLQGVGMPTAVTYGDFNADGRLDVLTSNTPLEVGDGSWAVYENESEGTISFGSPIEIENNGFTAQTPAVGDLNNDGLPDFVAAVLNQSKFFIYENTTTGGAINFQLANEITVPVISPEEIKIGDVDGDGRADVVVAGGNNNYLLVYRNISNGSTIVLDEVGIVYLESNVNATFLDLGDVNNDGLLDVVAASPLSNTISVFVNVSSPGFISFNAQLAYNTQGFNPREIDLGDADGDGLLDIVVANHDSNEITVLKNTNFGYPDFTSYTEYLAANGPEGVAIVDVDNDGRSDITFSNSLFSAISVIRNAVSTPMPRITDIDPVTGGAADGIWIYGQNFGNTPAQNVVRFGAVLSEVLYGNNGSLYVEVPHGATHDLISVTVNGLTAYSSLPFNKTYPFFGDVTGSYVGEVELTPGFNGAPATSYATIADINGDGKSDIITTLSDHNTVTVFQNVSSSGAISRESFVSTTVNTNLNPNNVSTADLDGDGKLDLVMAGNNVATPMILVMPNTSSISQITFNGTQTYGLDAAPLSLAISDIDLDGKPDIITGTANGTLSFLKNNTFPGYQPSFFTALNSGVFLGEIKGIATGDLNNDDFTDLAVIGTSGYVSVFQHNGVVGTIDATSFTHVLNVFTVADLSAISLADFDKDGDLDIVTSARSANAVYTIENQSSPASIVLGTPVGMSADSPISVNVADLNGDGYQDFLVANNYADATPGKLTLFVNQKNGLGFTDAFIAQPSLTMVNKPLSISAGDLDGDGRTDLVISDEGADVVSVLRNLNSSTAPVQQPTNLVFTDVTDHSAIAGFNHAISETPDGYLVLRMEGSTLPEPPASGRPYEIGETLSDGAVVVHSGSQNYFSVSGLESAETHTFAVYAFNGRYNAISYNTTSPLTGSVDMAGGTTYHENYFHWANSIGGLSEDVATGIDCGPDGSIYVTGYFGNTVDFDPGAGVQNRTAQGTIDAFVVKYNTDGSFNWFQPIRAVEFGYAYGEELASDTQGNVYVSGIFTGQVTFDPGVDNVVLTSNGGYDLYIAKYSPTGDFLWARSFGSTSNDSDFIRNGLAADGFGNVYLGGEFAGNVDFGQGGTISQPASSFSYRDGFIAKYDVNGDCSWVRVINGPSEDYIRGIAVDQSGHVYGIGSTSSEIIYAQNSTRTLSGLGNGDIMLVKYDPSGNLVWDKIAGGSNFDTGEGIAVDADGSIYITGLFHGFTDFGTQEHPEFITNTTGSPTPYLVHYNADGDVLWTKSFRATSGATAFRVQSDQIGNVFMHGVFYGEINADPNTGSYPLASTGDIDQALFKVSANGLLRWAGNIGGSSEDIAADIAISPVTQDVIVAGTYWGSVQPNPEDDNLTLTSNGQTDMLLVRFGSSAFNFAGVPSIVSVTPGAAATGDAVTISGSNFNTEPSANQVFFGSTRAEVISGTATELNVSVPVSSTFDPVKVLNNNLSASSRLAFMQTYVGGENFSSDSFVAESASLSSGQQPSQAKLADLNDDGNLDLLVLDPINEILNIHFNNNTAGLIDASAFVSTTITLGVNPQGFDVADLDGDGRFDIVVANSADNTISIFRNTGGGAFAAPFTIIVGVNPGYIALGDIDADGKPDIAVSNTGSNNIALLKNRSAQGTLIPSSFAEPAYLNLTSAPIGIAIANLFNNDGLRQGELIVLTQSNEIAVHAKSDGIGKINPLNFTEVFRGTAASSATSLAVADFDSDGHPDVVTNSSSLAQAGIFINNSTSLNSGVVINTPNGPMTSVITADITGDGKPDILGSPNQVLVNRIAGTVDTNSFQQIVLNNTSGSINYLAAGDLDQDGKPDLAFVDAGVDRITFHRNNIQVTTPTVQASMINIVSGANEIAYNFTAGNGNRHMAVIRAIASTTASAPQDGIAYNEGAELSAGNGNQVAAILTKDELNGTISGLSSETEYQLSIFEYNDATALDNVSTVHAKYKTDFAGVSGNPISFYTLSEMPEVPTVFTTFVDGLSVTLNFSSIDETGASGYYIYRRQGSAINSFNWLTNGAAAGTPPGDVTLVTAVTSNVSEFVDESGLQAGVQYHYALVPYNVGNVSVTTHYNFNAAHATATPSAIANDPAGPPRNLTFDNVTASTLTVQFDAAEAGAMGYIVLRSDIQNNDVPLDGNAYNVDDFVGSNRIVFKTTDQLSQYSFDESGLNETTTYYYKVFSFNGPGNTVNYLESSPATAEVTTPFADLADPTITDGTNRTIPFGTNALFQATASDDRGIQSVKLFWRLVTSGDDYIEQELFSGSNLYEHNIDWNQISNSPELGIQYRWEVTDNAGKTAADGPYLVKIAIVADNGLQIEYNSYGSDPSNYRLISVPMVLQNKSIAGVFGDDLGQYDPKKWRLWRYNTSTQDNVEHSAGNIETGIGYWLIVKDFPGDNIDTGPGQSVTATPDEPFQLSLDGDWTLIGNPYPFEISWADVRNANPTITDLPSQITVFRTGTFDNVGTIRPFEGAFVKLNGTARDIVIPVEKTNGGRIASTDLTNPLDASDWEVNLQLKQGPEYNLISGFGMRQDAAEGYDPYDAFAVPRFIRYLDLLHHKKSGNAFYSKDFVPTSERFVWEFSVESNISGENLVTMTWDNSYFGNNEKELVLWDVRNQLGIDMRNNTQYSFDKNSSGTFRVLFGDAAFLEENTRVNNLVFHHVRPNPVSEEAAICFTLPHSERVTIEVTDVTGKIKERIFEGVLAKGYHEVMYNGGNHAKGVYITHVKAGRENAQQRMILK